MASRTKLVLGLLGAVASAAAVLFLFGLSHSEVKVPLYVVERETFRHRVSAEGHLRAVESTPIKVPSAVRRGYQIAWLAAEGRAVEEGEVVVRFDPTELEQTSAQAEADFQTTQLKIVKQEITGRAEVRNLAREADLAQGELDTAKTFAKRDEDVYSRFERIESEVDAELAAERGRHAESRLASKEALSQTELELLAIERRRAQAKIEQATKALELLEVRAPHAGLILLERGRSGEPVRTGDTVYSGQKVAEIPDLAEMEAEVFILEADAGGLAEGLPARVVIESEPDRVVPAVIRRVDTLAKPRIPKSPVQYFAVVLQLDESEGAVMKPGQRVVAEILTAEIEDVLVVPRQAIFEDENRRYVLRQAGRGFERVEVTLGAAGLGRVVVASGLDVGDTIAAGDPDRARETVLGSRARERAAEAAAGGRTPGAG